MEDDVDGTGGLVYCLEAAGMTPTKPQAKCEDGVAKSLIKFTGSKSKCFDTCVDKEFKGKIPAGSCTAGSPSDAATQACIEKAQGKAADAIDKVCGVSGAKPSCYAPPRGLRCGLGCGGREPRRHADAAGLLPGADDDHHDRRDHQHHHDNGRDDDDHHHQTATTTTTMYGSPSRAFLAPSVDLLE